MNSSTLVFILILFFCVIIPERRQQAKIIHKKIKMKREKMESNKMKDLAIKFIEKECIIYTFNSQISGVIKEISENGGAILVQNNGNNTEIVNLDYVTRIKEYPRNKKGKKKAFVLE